MKKLYNFGFVFFALLLSTVQTDAAATVHSGASGNDLKSTAIENSLAETKGSNKKFILVDLYTDWCGWCKKMDENTFSDVNTISTLNENFTYVKFNAEITDPVTFNNKTYAFVKTGARGANKLALDLGSVNGKLGYPTLVILDESGTKLQAFPGYKDVESLNVILRYYISGSYKTMDFQQFQSGQ